MHMPGNVIPLPPNEDIPAAAEFTHRNLTLPWMVAPVKLIKMCPPPIRRDRQKPTAVDLVDQTGIPRWEDILPLEKIVAEGVPQPRPKRIFFQSNGIADEDLAVGK